MRPFAPEGSVYSTGLIFQHLMVLQSNLFALNSLKLVVKLGQKKEHPIRPAALEGSDKLNLTTHISTFNDVIV